MPVPPPPPPPPPPPAAIQAPVSKSNKQLLQSIEKGTKLKKVPESAKNDRSSGLVAAGATPAGGTAGARSPQNPGGPPMIRPPVKMGNGPIDFQSELRNQLTGKKSGDNGGTVSQERKPSIQSNNYVSVRQQPTQPFGTKAPMFMGPSSSNQPSSMISAKPAAFAPSINKPPQASASSNRETPPLINGANKPGTTRAPPAKIIIQNKPSIQSPSESNRSLIAQNKFEQSNISNKVPSSPSSPFQSNRNHSNSPHNRTEPAPLTNDRRLAITNENQSSNNKAPQQNNPVQLTNYRRPSTNENQSSNNKAPQQTNAIPSNNYRRPSTNENQSSNNKAPQQINPVQLTNYRRPSTNENQSSNNKAPQQTNPIQATNYLPPSTSNRSQSNDCRPSQQENPVLSTNNWPPLSNNQNKSLNNRAPPPNPMQSNINRPLSTTNQNQPINNRSTQPSNQFQVPNNRPPVTANQSASSHNRAPPAPNQTDHRAPPPPPPPNSKPILGNGISENYVMPTSCEPKYQPVRAPSNTSTRSAPNVPVVAPSAYKPSANRSVTNAPAPPPPLSSSSFTNDQRASVGGLPYKVIDRAPPPPPPPTSSHPRYKIVSDFSAFDRRFQFPDESQFPML